MEIKANVTTVLCKCISVTRTNWDKSRNSFRYTALMRPVEGESDDIFATLDMFATDYRIPLRDEVLRKRPEFANLAANDEDEDAKKDAWDNIVSKQLEGKTTNVHTCTLTVSELTGGLYKSYVLKIDNETSYEVTSRTVATIGNIDAAIGRISNQVMRACKEQQEGDGE